MVTVLHQYLLAQTDNGLRAVLAQSKPLLVTGNAPNPGTPEHPSTGPPPGGRPVHLVIPPGLVQYNVELIAAQRPPQELVQGGADLLPPLPAHPRAPVALPGLPTL